MTAAIGGTEMIRKGNFVLELQNQEEWSKEKAASLHQDDVHDTEDSRYGGEGSCFVPP